MSHYTLHECGPLEQWKKHPFEHPEFDRKVFGKHFLGEPLELTGMEISVNALPSGAAVPFLHRHRRNEEVYLFLSGSGEFQVDDEVFPVGPGSAVRVAPAGARCWRNTGGETMHYIVIQAPADADAARTITDGLAVEEAPRWATAAPV